MDSCIKQEFRETDSTLWNRLEKDIIVDALKVFIVDRIPFWKEEKGDSKEVQNTFYEFTFEEETAIWE